MHKSEKNTIGPADFCRMFACEMQDLPEQVISGSKHVNTTYHDADWPEMEKYILSVLQQISVPYIVRSRDENLEAFEKGWRENLEALFCDGISMESLKPKYFRTSKFLRYNKKLIVTE